MEKKILRLLIVDDSPDDAELAAGALRNASFMLKTLRVQDLASMQAALDKSTWDFVICEVTLAHFGAPMALELLKRLQLGMPLIAFTRDVKDADVAKLMRAGAVDIVRKDEAFRLGPVIERELRVADDRRVLRALAQKLSELESKHRAVVESAREAIGYCQDGMHIDANPIYLDLFGYSKGELEGLPVMNLIEKGDQARFKEYLRKGNKEAQEFLAIKKDGGSLHVELVASPVTLNSEACTQIIVADISKRKAAESRLHYLTQHDALTGLYNRTYFVHAVNQAIEKARKGGPASGLMYFDLNQIKAINDAFGHSAGDRMLLKLARLFRESLGDEVLLSRVGGDEFAVLISNTSDSQLQAAREKITTALRDNAFDEGGKTFTFHSNVGTAIVGKDTSNAQKLLSDVYHAAQPAGESAPRLVSAATVPTAAPVTALPELNAPRTPAPKVEPRRPTPKMVGPGEWAARLQTALDKNSFRLVYQPIVNLHGEPAEFYEVLIRLIGDNGKEIPAGEFMPAAERAGMGPPIDRWVMLNAIEALRELHRDGRRATFFINLCPESFREPDLIVQAQKQLRATNVKPEYVSFEADEEAVLAAPAEARACLQAVKKLGCRFTVDNFGNNMTNLNQLRDLPLDFLKIAGEHIRHLSTDDVAQASLKALVQVAKALDKKIIAKSVEKAEDLAVLWNLGVDYVQGNYFQEADARLSYDFGGETTLSSEVSLPPHWANTRNGR